MDRRMVNAIMIGLICGVMLVLYTLLANGITGVIYFRTTGQPPITGGPTPIPSGNLSEGIAALLIEISMITVGWMLILASGGAFYAWLSRNSLHSIRETITWSSIAGISSFAAMIIIAIGCLTASMAISFITSSDLSKSVSSMNTDLLALLIVLSPIWAIVAIPGVMSMAIGGFACRAFVLKQADSGEPNGH